jgi:transcriptional regulator with XRE-family HTH domain
MRMPSRTPRNTSMTGTPLRVELRLSVEDLAAAAGISPARLARLIGVGLVEPVSPGERDFSAATAARLRRMLRLHADLRVSLAGARIIVDLLERLERLEAELSRRRPGP